MARALALLAVLTLFAPAAAAETPCDAPQASLRQALAQAPGLGWLGVFGSGMQFTVPHQGSGLDLRGGAYLKLRGNLSLRGSYRVFDYDGEPGDSSLETDYHGPLLGLSLSF